MIKRSKFLIGNSSSGLIEIPYLGVPTVNIGDRQKSRLKANTVIDCKNDPEDIYSAIKLAISSDFKDEQAKVKTPYKKGNVSFQIKEVLKSYPLDSVLEKPFVDMKIQEGMVADA